MIPKKTETYNAKRKPRKTRIAINVWQQAKVSGSGKNFTKFSILPMYWCRFSTLGILKAHDQKCSKSISKRIARTSI